MRILKTREEVLYVVSLLPQDENGCRDGLILFSYGSDGRPYMVLDGKSTAVARIVLGLSNDDPLRACHTCDNGWCVEDAHLWAGTHAENMADMRAKGRNPGPTVRRGEDNPKACLTKEQADFIREYYGYNKGPGRQRVKRGTITILCDTFDISRGTVLNVVNGRYS